MQVIETAELTVIESLPFQTVEGDRSIGRAQFETKHKGTVALTYVKQNNQLAACCCKLLEC